MYERTKVLLEDDVLPLLIGLLLSFYTIFRWVGTMIWVVDKVEPERKKRKISTQSTIVPYSILDRKSLPGESIYQTNNQIKQTNTNQ